MSAFQKTSPVALTTLVHCLVRSLDQTERLPLNLFEFIPYRPSARRPLNPSPSAALPAPANMKPPPVSCPAAANTAPVFTFDLTPSAASQPATLPLGLLVSEWLNPRLEYHRGLLAGGVAALVDSRLTRLLGSWFPWLALQSCAGCAGMQQIQRSCLFTMRQSPDEPERSIINDSGLEMFLVREVGNVSMPVISWSGSCRDHLNKAALQQW